MVLASNYPARVGLYDPANEHDACDNLFLT